MSCEVLQDLAGASQVDRRAEPGETLAQFDANLPSGPAAGLNDWTAPRGARAMAMSCEWFACEHYTYIYNYVSTIKFKISKYH